MRFPRSFLPGAQVLRRALHAPRCLLPVLLAACVALLWAGSPPPASRADAYAQGQELERAGRIDASALAYARALVPGQRDPRLSARLGRLHAEQGLLVRARELLADAAEQLPDDIELHFRSAEVRFALGEWVAARRDAQVVVERQPRHAEAPLLLAMASRTPELAEEARRLLEALPVAVRDGAPVLTALAFLDWRANATAAAEAGLRRALRTDPRHAPAHALLADLLAESGDALGRGAALQSAAGISGLRSRHVIALARHQLERGTLAEAEVTLDRVLRVNPLFPPALLARAEVAEGQGRRDDALRFAEAGPAAGLPLPAALELSAHLRRARGEDAAAVAHLEALLRDLPSHAPAHYGLASLRASAGDRARARQSLEMAVRNDPGLSGIGRLAPGAPWRPGPALRRPGLERALELLPESPDLIEAFVRLDLEEGRADAAARRALAWVERAPALARAHQLLAQVRRAQSDRPAAVAELTRVLELDPDVGSAALALAELHLQVGNFVASGAVVERLLQRQPDQPDALFFKAVILERGGRNDAARSLYERITRDFPAMGVAFNNLGFLLAEHFKDLDGAFAMARRARVLLPRSPEVADTLGWVLHLRGDHAGALPLLRESVRGAPSSPESHYRLGLACERLGERTEARGELQRALDLGLSGSPAAEARRILTRLSRD